MADVGVLLVPVVGRDVDADVPVIMPEPVAIDMIMLDMALLPPAIPVSFCGIVGDCPEMIRVPKLALTLPNAT